MNEELREIIAEELEVESSDLTKEVILEDIEGWDSVAILTVLVILSDETGVQINPCEMANLKTFGDIEALILQKKSNNGSSE